MCGGSHQPLFSTSFPSRATLAPKLEAGFRCTQATGEPPAIGEHVIPERLRRAAAALPICDEDHARFAAAGAKADRATPGGSP